MRQKNPVTKFIFLEVRGPALEMQVISTDQQDKLQHTYFLCNGREL